jgi:hypothetical protein
MKQRNDNLFWTLQEIVVLAIGALVLLAASWIVI